MRFARLICMTTIDERVSPDAGDTETAAPRGRSGLRVWLVASAAIGLVLVALAVLIGGSGGNGSGKSASSAGTVRNATPVPAVPAVPAPVGAPGAAIGASAGTTSGAALPAATGEQAGSKGVTAGGGPNTPNTPGVPIDTVSKVVKTGEMDLAVDKGKVPAAMNQLMALATLERGYIANSHSEQGPSPSGSVTLRVPVQSFEATLADVRQLRNVNEKVLSQQTAGEDVTNQYVDLQARLHSLVATRSTFERILARATTIGDTLAVQSRITDVQTQIERLQGQLRVLNDQTTFGTLTVTLDENIAKVLATHHHQSGMSKAFHRSLDRFINGIEAIVGIIGPLLLVALLAGLAWLVGRVAYRRIRRQPA